MESHSNGEAHAQEKNGNENWETSSYKLDPRVRKLLKQIPGGENKLIARMMEAQGNVRYSRDLNTKVSCLLDLTSRGFSRWKPLNHWKRYRGALQPPGLNERTGEKLELGTLIDTAFHTKSLEETTDIFDANETATICGPVYTKIRTVIVVALHFRHAVCVPIYSHNGEGLKYKNEKEIKEFVAVWARGGDRWVPENELEALKATEHVFKAKTAFLCKKSYVKFTEPACHDYGAPCRIVGKLEDRSTDRLLKLLNSTFSALKK